jgi:hypothetical protein
MLWPFPLLTLGWTDQNIRWECAAEVTQEQASICVTEVRCVTLADGVSLGELASDRRQACYEDNSVGTVKR